MWCSKLVTTRYMHAERTHVLPPAHLHIHLTIAMSFLSPLCCTMMQSVDAHPKVARLALRQAHTWYVVLCSH